MSVFGLPEYIIKSINQCRPTHQECGWLLCSVSLHRAMPFTRYNQLHNQHQNTLTVSLLLFFTLGNIVDLYYGVQISNCSVWCYYNVCSCFLCFMRSIGYCILSFEYHSSKIGQTSIQHNNSPRQWLPGVTGCMCSGLHD